MKRPGRPERVMRVLSVAESRRRDAEMQEEDDVRRARVSAVRERFLLQADYRSSAVDDTE